jgi:hypothetical protein
MDAIERSELECRVGDTVMSADEHKLGKVVACDARYLTVEHGVLNKGDYYVPMEVVNTRTDNTIYVNVTKDQVTNAGWDAPPPVSTDAAGSVIRS